MKNTILFSCFILLFSIKVFSQDLIKNDNYQFEQQSSKANNSKDSIAFFGALNKKIIINKGKIYFLYWKDGERIIIADNDTLIENISPFIPIYLDFYKIPKAWDIEDNMFWALNGVFIKKDGHPLYVTAKGILERIPLSRLDSWTGKNIERKDFPPFDTFVFNRDLPLYKLTYEKYYLKRLSERKEYSEYEDKKTITVRLSQNTYFDILITKDGIPNYILYFNNQLSIWKLNNNQWQSNSSFDFSTNGYFTCFEHKKQLYLIGYDSNIYKIHKGSLEKIVQLPVKLIDISLVINKDEDSIGYVMQADIQNTKSIKKVVEQKAIPIFSKK